MYDKVNLRIIKDQETEPTIKQLAECLTGVRTTTDEAGEILYRKGTFNGLSVTLSDREAKLTGSLTKYLTGSNYNSMRQPDISEAVRQLSYDLRLRPEAIGVTALEIGNTFVMNNEPGRYIEQLAKTAYLPRFQKVAIKGSLYFKQKAGQRQLIFYDKEAEMKARGEPVPAGLYNLLRYELRLHYMALKRYLPTKTLTDLSDRQVFITLRNEWRGYFESMYKTATTAGKRSRGKDLLLQYIYSLQKRYDTLNPSDLIEWLNETLRGKANAHRLKQEAARFFAMQEREDNGLLSELRDRITEAVLS